MERLFKKDRFSKIWNRPEKPDPTLSPIIPMTSPPPPYNNSPAGGGRNPAPAAPGASSFPFQLNIQGSFPRSNPAAGAPPQQFQGMHIPDVDQVAEFLRQTLNPQPHQQPLQPPHIINLPPTGLAAQPPLYPPSQMYPSPLGYPNALQYHHYQQQLLLQQQQQLQQQRQQEELRQQQEQQQREPEQHQHYDQQHHHHNQQQQQQPSQQHSLPQPTPTLSPIQLFHHLPPTPVQHQQQQQPPPPPPQGPIQPPRRVYDPPAVPPQNKQQLPGSVHRGEVSNCTQLLRRLYLLEVEMWSSQHARGGPAVLAERARKREEADDIFEDIHQSIEAWTAAGQAAWTQDEWQSITMINRAIAALRARRIHQQA